MTENDERIAMSQHNNDRHMAASDLAARLVEVLRATTSWSVARQVLVDGAKHNRLDEDEVALRFLLALGWPLVDGDDDALEAVATACCGDDDLWWRVMGGTSGTESTPAKPLLDGERSTSTQVNERSSR